MADYRPPFSLTAEIVSLVAAIAEQVGRLAAETGQATDLRLRRLNRIRTITGSLAIEGNSLSEEQVTALLEGKRVLGSPRELQEARNALAAYEQIPAWTGFGEADLLAAHQQLMEGLLDTPGRYRTGGVGVMAGPEIVHMAPPAERVPELMEQLFEWLSSSQDHPLISSSVFHYEFEFIHPFADGNGRLGRLWQTVLLSHWQPEFAWLPVESLVHANQEDYYAAIATSTTAGDCAPFITFMLNRIHDAIGEVTPQVTPQVTRLVSALTGEMSRNELQAALKLTDRENFRKNYLQPALAAGLIEMTLPNKPNSRNQRYRLTPLARSHA